MNDFIAAADQAALQRHGLDSFSALWDVQLEPIDQPNRSPNGWSEVYRLALDGKHYYLKRQSNYFTHTLRRPWGEPTLAHEFRSIRRYRQLRIPALQAAFFAHRKVAGEQRAVLLTPALDGWHDLDGELDHWATLPAARRQAIVRACGELARTLHDAGQQHGCFYPKHIFLRARDASGEAFDSCVIDLEKTRPLLFNRRDRIKDLESLTRRSGSWSELEVQQFLRTYLDDGRQLDTWLEYLQQRTQAKQVRS